MNAIIPKNANNLVNNFFCFSVIFFYWQTDGFQTVSLNIPATAFSFHFFVLDQLYHKSCYLDKKFILKPYFKA